jgi:hypothetical protein
MEGDAITVWFRKRYRLPLVLLVVSKVGAIAALAWGLWQSEKMTGLVRGYFQPEQVIDQGIKLYDLVKKKSA